MPSRSSPTIIAGAFKGRRLQVPDRSPVRPTRSMVRGALFDMIGPRVDGCVALDLFAGAGVLGLEALSRGAAHVLFVERDRRALSALRANVAACEVSEDRFTLLPMDADEVVVPASLVIDLLLLDPPFARRDPVPTSVASSLAAAEDIAVALHAPSERPAPPRVGPWTLRRERTHGRSRLCLYGPPSEGAPQAPRGDRGRGG